MNCTWIFDSIDVDNDELFFKLLEQHPASCILIKDDVLHKFNLILYHSSLLIKILEEAIETKEFNPRSGIDPRFSIETIKNLTYIQGQKDE